MLSGSCSGREVDRAASGIQNKGRGKGRKQLMLRIHQRISRIRGFRWIRDHLFWMSVRARPSQPVHVGAESPARKPWRCAPRRAADGTTPKRLRNAVTKWLNEPKP